MRAERGLFYTPDDLADLVATRAIALWRQEHPGLSFAGRTVLDPSCGAGALLAAAQRALGDVPARFVGTDVDSSAVALARRRLGPRALVELGDALAPGAKADVVLTNPPYGRDPETGDRRRFVRFWRAALERVAPGGVLAVLAPRAWQTGVRYASARRSVVDPSGVRRVVDVPSGSFSDAYVDTCLALCVPGDRTGRAETARRPEPPEGTTLGALFLSRRGILAPPLRSEGERMLVGRVVPFVWPTRGSAFARVVPGEVIEGKAALTLARGPRLLIRRIVGRARRLTCITTTRPALVKKDFYVFSPREGGLCLPAYAALLHARGIAERLAARETAATKDDFAQVTLTRLRELRVPRLAAPPPEVLDGVAHLTDSEVDARDPGAAAAWLELFAKAAARVGRALSREHVHRVDADGRWGPLRARLDAFVARMEIG